jgi:hypothetical protein
MAKEEKSVCDCSPKNRPSGGGVMGGAYGLAFIGAVIYFIQHADTFWMGVYGVLKAMVWPAILAYKLLEYLRV